MSKSPKKSQKTKNKTTKQNGIVTNKPVNLALQGGGSHGAFTWGVLDRLLEDGRLSFAAISGTSAGAMNACALADGWSRNGAQGARDRLEAFWRAVSDNGQLSPIQRTPIDMLTGNWSLENNPTLMWFEMVSRSFSPKMANPLGLNPLRDIVSREIDFESVHACPDIDLLISATNVETGKVKVFEKHELGVDHVMASACLPTLFPAVEIDGVPYWDGGYGGNPALFPFFYQNKVEDVLLVQINPILREGAPETAREIQNRIDEITFNAGLQREFRAIAFVRRLIENGNLSGEQYRAIRMHRIDADEAFADLTATTKISVEWAFLTYLRDLGRAAADDWLDVHFDDVGKASTLDLSDELSPEMQPKRASVGARVREMMEKHRAETKLKI